MSGKTGSEGSNPGLPDLNVVHISRDCLPHRLGVTRGWGVLPIELQPGLMSRVGFPGSELVVQEADWRVSSGSIPERNEGSRTGQRERFQCSVLARKASADASGSSGSGMVPELF